ncbi:tyrosine-type recombinase/integrase [uncultured Nostoc sp.]|uniref:tyrosine-type recombinase/integrase n=1 Tax=uncultured Nostoc sp. TaxID=340711 RepID=UPI0035CA4C94
MATEVGIENKAGKLRLRLPRAIAVGSSRYISTGLGATPENLKKAQVVSWQIEEDIKTGQLDPTLERYKQQFRPKTVVVTQKQTPDLIELWFGYAEYKRHQLAETTYRKDYLRKFPYHLRKLPTRNLTEAIVIRDYLLLNLSAATAKKVLRSLAACCAWAVKSGIITVNPFAGMAADVRQPKHQRAIDPFTSEERTAILEAFRQRKPHYLSFVQFLFLTGCRTGEAIALQWKHINSACTQITFCESYDGELKLRKITKTGVSRRFPCNQQLSSLLLSIRPTNPSSDSLVFTSPTGLPVHNSEFTNKVWKGRKDGQKFYRGIVTTLVDEGKVQRYRCLYNTRHTFISECIEAGVPIPQIARWVGNSPEIIMRHYAGCVSSLEVPNLL